MRSRSALSQTIWLVGHTAAPDKSGWGLPVPWGAFGDGSVNPASAVYGITDALAVSALLNVYDATKDARYLNAAHAALSEYAAYFKPTADGGYFWYSDQLSDAIDTANVTAMLAGQYARAAHYFHDSSFAEFARLTHAHVIATHKTIGNASYWFYSPTGKAAYVNDLVHHALIIKGLLDYGQHTGDQTGIAEALAYLPHFWDAKTIYQFPRHNGVSSTLPVRPAQLWGIGMLAYVSARAGDARTALHAVNALPKYKTDRPGVYGQFPGLSAWLPDQQAYLLYGLAEYEARWGG